MPVGAYGGRKEIMDLISPCGPVYQAGTLSGNPVAMAAGFTQLKYLYEHQEIYKDLASKGEKLYGGLKKIVEEKGLPYQVNYDSSLASIFVFILSQSFLKNKLPSYYLCVNSCAKSFFCGNYRSPRAPLIASRVSSITSSVCAVERNIASNWEGAR